jgi:ATP-binding cassette subfamily B protein
MAEDKGPPPGAPDDEFDSGPPLSFRERWELVRYFLRYLKPVRGLMVLVVLGTAISSVTSLPLTFLPKVLTERFDNTTYVTLYCLLSLAAFVAGSVLGLFLAYWGASIGETVVRSLRRALFDKLESLSMQAVYARGPGQLVQQVGRDVFAVRELFGNVVLHSGIEIAQGLAVVVAMLVLAPWLTLAILAGFLALAGVIRLANRPVEEHAGRARMLMQQLMGLLVEAVGGFRDIVAANRFRGFSERFDHLLAETRRENIRTNVWGQAAGLVPATLVSLAVLAVYYFGWRRSVDVSEIGGIITYTSLLSQLFPAMMALARTTTDLAMAMPSLLSLCDVLEQPGLSVRPDARTLAEPVRSIRFDHVGLEVEGRPILADLSFEIPHGQLTAIVGQSGSGKTTLFHVLLRLLEPTAGVVLINERPAGEHTTESVRARIGFIPQNPFLFNESLRENILLAAPEEVSPEALGRALDLAQLEEVVSLRKDQGGLDAEVGYMGTRLSGGERQRVALARLVLRNPDVIVCDEYTANVDVKTARLIHEAMRTHFAGQTRVIITHELASARSADHIVVIDHGRVVQQGTHEQLRAVPGLYRDLLEVQRL